MRAVSDAQKHMTKHNSLDKNQSEHDLEDQKPFLRTNPTSNQNRSHEGGQIQEPNLPFLKKILKEQRS